jgi:glycosyltransferase involved in cell wall biosynthesis
MNAVKNYPYKISVVMAVYNSEEYLEEAIESVVRQTLGFQHIQLIMVDDGSTDSSGKLCDGYAKQYPDNIIVIHQKNEGRASASNMGLQYITGEYVNFLDSDDKIRYDSFEQVYDFFEKHKEETDIVSIPMVYFGAKEGPHALNYKYEKGTRVVSLFEEQDVVQLHLGSSFVRHEIAKKINFDTTQVVGIDARECMRILMDKMTLGLVSEGVYYYRIRSSENNLSILQAGKFKPKRYTYHLERFSQYILAMYRERYGEVPHCIQYAIMYELQSRIRQKKIPDGVMNQEEIQQYRKKIQEVLTEIDDEIILAQRNLNYSQMIGALSIKYQKAVSLKFLEKDAKICVGEKEVRSLSSLIVQINQVKRKKSKLYLQGYMNFVGIGEDDSVKIFFWFRNKRYELPIADTQEVSTWLMKFSTLKYFEGTIPVAYWRIWKKNGGFFETELNEHVIQRKALRFSTNLKTKITQSKIIPMDNKYGVCLDKNGEMSVVSLRKKWWLMPVVRLKKLVQRFAQK